MYFGMKNFYIIFFTFIFFTSNAFSYHCWFRPYSGDIRVASINGRQIYTLFTRHLSNQGDEFYNILNLSTDIGIIEAVGRFISKHIDTINSERSDFQQIRSLLTSRKIDWIGIEQTPDIIQSFEQVVQNYRETKDSFNQRSNASLWNQEESDDLLYLLYPVWLKLLAEYPSDIILDGTDGTDGIRVIPLENKDLAAKATMAPVVRSFERVIHDTNLTDEQRSAFVNFALNHPSILNVSILIDLSDTEEFFTSSGIENPELIKKIEGYIDLRNELTITHQQRDAYVIQLILNQEGSGLVLRGSAHQENVESGLTQVCVDSRGL